MKDNETKVIKTNYNYNKYKYQVMMLENEQADRLSLKLPGKDIYQPGGSDV